MSADVETLRHAVAEIRVDYPIREEARFEHAVADLLQDVADVQEQRRKTDPTRPLPRIYTEVARAYLELGEE